MLNESAEQERRGEKSLPFRGTNPDGLRETRQFLKNYFDEQKAERLAAARSALAELEAAREANEKYTSWTPEGPPVSGYELRRLTEKVDYLQRQTTLKGRIRSAIEQGASKIIHNADMLMVSVYNFSNVRPMFNERGDLVWVIMPNARINSDPRQLESQIYNGQDNIYNLEFKRLKDQGVKAVTAEHMSGELPWVQVSGLGRLQFLDHNRILGAQTAEIPIEAVFTRKTDTFS